MPKIQMSKNSNNQISKQNFGEGIGWRDLGKGRRSSKFENQIWSIG
jgi:hypothetical protein